MELPNEIQTILKFIDNGMIWVYIGLFIVVMYLLISLLTFSFIKPLKYLGIPTILVGILLVIIRLSANVIINSFDVDLKLAGGILSLALKPLLISGIGCTILGVLMIVGYKYINRKPKDNDNVNNMNNYANNNDISSL